MPNAPSPSELQSTAAQWLARRNNGEPNAGDQRAFLQWLNASPANREAYEQAEVLWEQMRDLDDIAAHQLAEARAYLQRSQSRPTRRRFAALAAMLLLSIGAVWYADLFSHLHDESFRTVLGERKKINLADGSQLELNSDSEAKVHYSRRGREVSLTRGQAVFTVVHDGNRPFDVLAGSGRIRDIGTQFDVRHVEGGITVAVLDGEVDISGSKDSKGQRLQRGQRLDYRASGEVGTPQIIDINTVSAWREGKVVFQGQALKEVLAELGRYHHGDITVTSPQILSTRVTGVFPTDNLPQALRTMAAALPIKLTQTGPQSWQIDKR